MNYSAKTSSYSSKEKLSKSELSSRIKDGMRDAQWRGVHIGRTPKFFQRTRTGSIYLNPYVKEFLLRYWPYREILKERHEIKAILWKWYENEFEHIHSKPVLTVEDIYQIRRNPLYGKASGARDTPPQTSISRAERHRQLFPGRPVPENW